MPRFSRIEALMRLGFASRGLLYLLVGWFALAAGRRGAEGTFDRLDAGAGRWLLAAMALGFLGYGLWRLAEAWVDSEDHGGDASGLAVRIGAAGSGLLHLALAGVVASILLGAGDGGESGTRESVSTALQLQGGSMLIGSVAAGLAVAGLVHLVQAWRLDCLRHFDPRVAALPAVCWAGRIGYAARALVFVVMGGFFVEAARESQASEAGTMADALAALPDAIRVGAAVGLILFGLFSLVEARYRRIGRRVLARVRALAPDPL